MACDAVVWGGKVALHVEGVLVEMLGDTEGEE